MTDKSIEQDIYEELQLNDTEDVSVTQDEPFTAVVDIADLPDPKKLKILADWFEKQDVDAGRDNNEVQTDLRKWAENIETVIANSGKSDKTQAVLQISDTVLNNGETGTSLVVRYAPAANGPAADEDKEDPYPHRLATYLVHVASIVLKHGPIELDTLRDVAKKENAE